MRDPAGREAVREARQSTPGELRSGALRYVESLRSGPATYRMTPTLEGTLFTDCFAFFLRYLLDDDDREQRDALTERLLTSQDAETGLWHRVGEYRDPASLHDPRHVDRQLTGYALAALATLGHSPRHPRRFLSDWTEPAALRRYLETLPWSRSPSNSGNRAMFVGSFLAIEARFAGDRRAEAAFHIWLDWHDSHARPRSGYWGEGALADAHPGMTGAAHQYVLYGFGERRPPRLEHALERTLALQYPDGRFWPVVGGGSCYELDAAQILLSAFRHRVGDRSRVAAACRRMVPVVLSCLQQDGSFCWARRRRLELRDLFGGLLGPRQPVGIAWAAYAQVKAERRRDREERATAWAKGAHPVGTGSLFDTWFRLLTLAIVSQVVGEEDAPLPGSRSLPAPNWGHY